MVSFNGDGKWIIEKIYNQPPVITKLYHIELQQVYLTTGIIKFIKFSWFDPRSGQTKDYKTIDICCFSARPHPGVRAKTDWLWVRIMCPSGATCQSTIALYKLVN
jgi:hypothetical protein